MITFSCLAIAAILLGAFFNAYALVAVCAATALASAVSAVHSGMAPALSSAATGVVLLQAGYLVGLSASAVISARKPAPVPTR